MMNSRRVTSFMSNFSSRHRSESNSSPVSQAPVPIQTKNEAFPKLDVQADYTRTPMTDSPLQYNRNDTETPPPHVQRERAVSRPMSMVQSYQPPTMDVAKDTLPELQPIFTFLNSHGNKLYQEGYFLKLDDQDTYGRPNADRTWTECFAQLVGTVLSLWDAAELDAAGQEGEVLPKFINLTDSSIKMIEALPTRSDTEPPLQNVLSISTAGKNRYLLHFNSHHSLIQWTAGIRLAMFEHATLQEAYTGALIAGKGKALNNISLIMERTKFKTEDWARVRFGAGTPWRRCWCVIIPPDEKEVQKLRKEMSKKKSAYDRSRPPALKGEIRFYDTKKTKKISPIATITDAYTAFAIYPQAKPLIEASTLVKVEGSITIHSNPPSTTEGFVFVMPEVHPAVTGFEMMLRWLFPVFDTFALYGRPGRLAAEIKDPQSLMFAMPKHRRYGYLEILDVTGLILDPGSATWRESEWRRRMKELTLKRMNAIEDGSKRDSRYSSRRSTRNSFGPSRSRIQFDDAASTRSSPSIGWQHGPPADLGIPRTDSAPPETQRPATSHTSSHFHKRSVSETQGFGRYGNIAPSYDGSYDQQGSLQPDQLTPTTASREGSNLKYMSDDVERVSSEDETSRGAPVRELQDLQMASPEPVAAPPAFAHQPGSLPPTKPYHSPDLRRANSRMSQSTLSQLSGAGGVAAGATAVALQHAIQERPGTADNQLRSKNGQNMEDMVQKGVLSDANNQEYSANRDGQGHVAVNRFSFDGPSPSRPADSTRHIDTSQPPPHYPTTQGTSSRTYVPPQIFASSNSNAHGHSSHSSHPSVDSTHSINSQPGRITTRQSVSRKPLPPPPTGSSSQTPTSADTISSNDTIGKHIIDEGAFDMIKPPLDRTETTAEHHAHTRDRAETMDSMYQDSQYDDDEPDYASTFRPSVETPRYVERRGGPRTGVMRTVGTVEDVRYPHDSVPASSIPDIDFGPTMDLTSDRTVRKASPGPTQIYGATRGPSPGPGFKFPQDATTAGQLQSSIQPRTTSRTMLASDGAHYRNDSAENRTLPWQPGMTSMNAPALQQGITPEQFVQQRANVAPQYAHNRQGSSPAARNTTPTPPLVKNRSSDRLAQLGQGHSRHSSTDLLQWPNSRGPSAALAPAGNGDMPTTLSAREQEHVARVTGQPLINVAGNRQSTGAGLVGAIETREKERQQMKQGINSQAVQNAIAQRQNHGSYQQYPEPKHDYRTAQSSYGAAMGQYPQAQYGQSQYHGSGQMQNSYISPAANIYAQGGGFSSPSLYSPDAQQTPLGGLPYSPSSQYFNMQHQPRQQQQGRGNANYQPGRQY